MDALTIPQVSLLGFTFGASIAAGWMAALALRSVYTTTSAHRWYQLKQL
jgi:alpha/beta superfamily hydrolase